MQNFLHVHLSQATLSRYRLPGIAYPVPASITHSTSIDSETQLSALLYGLQEWSRAGGQDWKQYEDAMERLALHLSPDSASKIVTVSSPGWWLEFGQVDLDGRLVTIQRGDHLIAAIGRRDDGRLRVATYRPLDGKSMEYLTGLGQTGDPETGVCMREDNWEYALDCSAGTGNCYAADSGEAYLSYWEHGIGVFSDGTESSIYRPYKDLTVRPASRAAKELGVYCSFSTGAAGAAGTV